MQVQGGRSLAHAKVRLCLPRQGSNAMNLQVMDIAGSSSNGPTRLGARKPSVAAIAVFFRSLGTRFNAGVPIDRALVLLTKQTDDLRMASVCGAIHSQILEGQSLSQAMALCKGTFTPIQTRLIRVGETTGSLATILDRLGEHEEKRRENLLKVRSALAYPVVISLFSVVAFTVIATFMLDDLINLLARLSELAPAKAIRFL